MPYLIPKPQSFTPHGGIYRPDGEGAPQINRVFDSALPHEGYRLSIAAHGITVTCSHDCGYFYALKTLEQIRFQCGAVLPFLDIEDFPRYSYRGFMIDTARHFRTVDELKLMIDSAAMFKLNKFHWHLTDDQGWRAQVPALPALTEKGSYRRCSNFGGVFDNSPHGGFYTVEEMKEIVAYCRERFIDVVPEFEMPGHVTSLLAAFEFLSCTGKDFECKTTAGIFPDVLCMGNDETLPTVYKIIDSFCEIFTGEYFHIGGDEAPKVRWKACPKCSEKLKALGLKNENELQGWFMNTVADYLKQRGKKVITWNESLNGGNLDKDIIVQHWMDKTDNSKQRAIDGGRIIESDFFHYYLDYPYGMTPLKKTYTYDPAEALTPKGAQSVVGLSAQIWTEQVRTLRRMGYQCFPRLCAVAQRAWSNEGKGDYPSFKQSCRVLMPMLDRRVGFAPEKQWDLSPAARAAQTVSFFTRSLSAESIKQFFDNRRD